MFSRARLEIQTLSASGVRHLVVIFEKRDELRRLEIEGRSSAPLLLPGVALPLKQIPPLDGADHLLRSADVVSIIGLAAPRERDARGVVQVVVPERVEPTATLFEAAYQPRFLWLVFGDQNDVTRRRFLSRVLPYRDENVFRRVVVNVLRRIQAKTVQVKFVDPVARVRDVVVAHGSGVLAVEVDALAPVRPVLLRKIKRRKPGEVISRGTEVVVDDVENDEP
jgi:hypothetical protein